MADPLAPALIGVAVVGAGAFGRNHLRVYRELESATPNLLRLAACVDASAKARDHVAAQHSIPVFASVEELLASGLPLRAASVCVPTVHHAAVAEQLLHAGLDLLIEKPLAATRDQAEQITNLAESLDRIVQVGHLERFNPAVTALAENIARPMFFECHRLSIFTPRSLDVDVVLDLMIHDLDIVLALAKSPVREVRAVGLPVLSGKVDIANARVEFESGCIANFTASRISTERVRKLRLFQQGQYWSLDFARQELFVIEVDSAARANLVKLASLSSAEIAAYIAASQRQAAAQPPAANPDLAHPSPGLNLRKFDLPNAEPLRLEISDFLQAVRNRTQPRVAAQAGSAALALALQITEAIAEHAHRAGL